MAELPAKEDAESCRTLLLLPERNHSFTSGVSIWRPGGRRAAGVCHVCSTRCHPLIPAAKDAAPSHCRFCPLPADGLSLGQRDRAVLLPPINILCLRLSQVRPGIRERDLQMATSISPTAAAPCITRSTPAISLGLEESRCGDREDGKSCRCSPAPGITRRHLCVLCSGTAIQGAAPSPLCLVPGPLWTIPAGRGGWCLGSLGPSALSLLTIARKSWLPLAPRILGSPAHHPRHKSN